MKFYYKKIFTNKKKLDKIFQKKNLFFSLYKIFKLKFFSMGFYSFCVC